MEVIGDDWFPNPLNSTSISTDPPSWDWEDTAPSEYEPPHDESMSIESFKEDDWFSDKPEKKEETIHEKMYQMATARYNPFSLGGSENCDSDISCNIGGSENVG